MHRDKLTRHLNEYLNIDEFEDLGPNGLQVEGRSEIKKIVTGVSASVELFEKALEANADAVMVHHGIVWGFERPLYTGGYKKRVKLLLENDINLYGYHLPLDAHDQIGNNVLLARELALEKPQPFGKVKGQYIGYQAECQPREAEELFRQIRERINEQTLVFPFGPPEVQRIAIISGGAQKEVKQAVLQGMDVYITGEASEHIMHYAKEEGIHFVSAGHHATERFGIRALGDHLQNRFGLDVQYIDIPNPV